jgi:hypothetical protein
MAEKNVASVAPPKPFTSYAVVVFPDLGTVVSEVNSLLARGWSLVGGINVSAQGTTTYHYQAVAK